MGLRPLLLLCLVCLISVYADFQKIDDVPWKVTFVNRDYVDGQTTFSYNVKVLSLDGKDLASWLIAVPKCPQVNIVRTTPSVLDLFTIDELSGVNGLQWRTHVAAGKEQEYKLVVDGHVDSESLQYVVSGTGNGDVDFAVGSIFGPSCAIIPDAVCNAGELYTGFCVHHTIMVSLTSASEQVKSQEWSVESSSLSLDNPTSINPLLTIDPATLRFNTQTCEVDHDVTLKVHGQDGDASCIARVHVEDVDAPEFLGLYADDITVESFDVPVNPEVWAVDNCDSNVAVVEKEVALGTDPASHKLVRTWTVSDFCHNKREHIQTIHVQDTTPPTLRGVDESTTSQCHSVPPPCEVEAYDYNDVTVTMAEERHDVIGYNCEGYHTLIRIWTAVDAAGNTASASQTLSIVDTEPPSISGIPDDETVECDKVPASPDLVTIDSCGDATVDKTEKKIRTNANNYVLYRTWTAVDLCGNVASHSQTITVQDIVAPKLVGVDDDESIRCYEIPPPCVVTVIDNCDTAMDVVFTEEKTQRTCEDHYDLIRTWRTSDVSGNQASAVQVLRVRDTVPPKFTGLPPESLTVECSDIPQFAVSAIDKCDPSITVSLTEAKSPTIISDNEYNLFRNWIAIDRCGNQAKHTQFLSIQDTIPPTLAGVPYDIEVSCNSVPLLENSYVTVTDKCSCSSPLSVAKSEEKHAGSCLGEYTLVRTWNSQDCAHNSVEKTQTIKVIDTEKPVMTGLAGDQQVSCDDIPSAAVVGVDDNCDEEVTVVFSETRISGDCPDEYILVRSWSAVDVCGNNIQHDQNIAVKDNSPPHFMNPQDGMTHTFECDGDAFESMGLGHSFSYPEATDECDTNVNIQNVDTRTDGDCASEVTIVREYIASDNCGNQVSELQTFHVSDSTPPSLTFDFELEMTMEYPEQVLTPEVLATDTCAGEIKVELTEKSESWPPCPNRSFKTLRSWKATDVCGNVSPLLKQVITIQDSTPPSIIFSGPVELLAHCHEIPEAAEVIAEDHGGGEVTIELTETMSDVICDDTYIITRRWKATDECGNSDFVEQQIHVTDDASPVLSGIPADLTTECEGWEIPVVTVTDNCDNVTVGAPQVVQVEGVEPEVKFVVTRTWSVVDKCSNSAIASQVITIKDTLDPSFVSVPDSITVECDDETSLQDIPHVEGIDACDEVVDVTYDVQKFASAACDDFSIYHRIWVVVDEAQHSVSAEQVVIVKDTTGPVFVNPPPDSTVECSENLQEPLVEVADACDPDVDYPAVDRSEEHVEKSPQHEYAVIFEYTADDRCGNTNTLRVRITVHDIVKPTFDPFEPVVDLDCTKNIADQTLLTATDDCYNVETTFTDTTISQTCEDSYIVVREWTVVDGSGNLAATTQTFNVEDLVSPVVGLIEAEIEVSYLNIPGYPDLIATDNCAEVTPQWTNITVTQYCNHDYEFKYTAHVEDNCGHFVDVVQRVTVRDVIPPTIEPQYEDRTIECNQVDELRSMEDVSTNDPSNTINSINTVKENDDCTHSYTIRRIWIAQDDCGNFATYTQTVKVVDSSPPVLDSSPADVTVDCTHSEASSLSATDNCGADGVVNAAVTRQNDLNPTNYKLINTWSYSDPCGNIATEVQTVTVVDETPPVILHVPADATVDYKQIPIANADVVACQDNCGSATAGYGTTLNSGTCINNYLLIRTWTCTDEAALKESSSATITVVDNGDDLFFTDKPGDQTIQWKQGLDALEVPTVESMKLGVDVTYTTDNNADGGDMSTDLDFSIYRNWRAEDECGNVVTHTQTIVVEPPIPPTLPELPDDEYKSCDEIGEYLVGINTKIDEYTVKIEEEVPDNNVLTTESLIEPGLCPNQYDLIVTWIVTDEAGQSISGSMTIHVQDTKIPQWEEIPEAQVVASCKKPDPPVVKATDNCAKDLIGIEGIDTYGDSKDYITVAFEEVEVDGMFLRTWTAVDACGSNISTTQRVQVTDSEPPVLEPPPADVTVDCTSIPNQVELSATDNCDIVTVVKESSGEPDPCEYNILFTWSSTDKSGHVARVSQQVTVKDEVAPRFVTSPLPPAEVTVECDAIIQAEELLAIDNCGNPTGNFVEELEDSICAPWTIVRTWTSTDRCGLISSHVQTIFVQDTTDAVLSGVPKDETRQCDDLSVVPIVKLSDNCDTIAFFTPISITELGTCDDAYSIVRSWTVTDCSGQVQDQLSQKQVVTYIDTTPPTVSGLTDDNRVIILTCPNTMAPKPDLKVKDNCDASPNVDLQLLTLSSTNSHNYAVERTWVVTDNCGNSVQDEQTVVYEDVTDPSIICDPSPVTVDCSSVSDEAPASSFMNTPASTDSCSEVILSNPSLQKRIDGACEGTYDVVYLWSVTDASGLESSCEQTVQVSDNNAPYFEMLPADLTIECDETMPNPDVSIVDSCFSDVSYNVVVVTIAGECADIYSVKRKWDTFDDCGHHTHHEQFIQVTDSTVPELLHVPDNENYSCEDVPQPDSHGVIAQDNCDDNVILQFEAEITTTECTGGTYEYTLTWTGTDRCGNEVEASKYVDVYDSSPPTLNGVPQHITVDCHKIPTKPNVNLVDNCHEQKPANFRTERLDGPSLYQYDLIRIWSGSDPCGNSVESDQTLTVTDDIAPDFSFLPEDKQYNCNDVYIVGILNANDNCSQVEVEQDGPNRVLGSCDNAYLEVTTWIASDTAGNEVSWTQTLTIVDIVSPVLLHAPNNVAVECDQVPEAFPLHVVDNCTKDIDPVYPTEEKPADHIESENDYMLLRTWVAHDECGNQAVATQSIYVKDTINPTFDTHAPVDKTVSCASVPDPEEITATDNCVENVVVVFVELTQPGNCAHEYSLSREWTATDNSGNSHHYNQRIKVYDDQSPQLSPIPSDEFIDCDSPITVPNVGATDLCSGSVAVELTETIQSGITPNDYNIIREWRAVDECNLASEAVQTVTVHDNVPPILHGNSDSIAEIGKVPVPGKASVQDNCDQTIPSEVECFETKESSSVCLYIYKLVYVCAVTDASGNFNEHRYTVSVQDTIAPVFYFDETNIGGVPPPDITVEYGQHPSLDESLMGVVAVDNSEHEIVLLEPKEVLDFPNPDNDHEYTIIWTYTACDDCGNCAQIDRKIAVTDTTPPCFSEEPPSGEVECDNIPPPCDVTTVDENLVVSTSHSDIFEVDDKKIITRTWTAEDQSGNKVSYTQTLVSVDHSPPVFSRYPDSETVSCSCDSFPLAPTVNAIDNCDFSVTVSFTEDKILGISPDQYALERVWFAQDNSGNIVSHKQVITVEDTEAPVLSREPPHRLVECDNIPEAANVYIKDNCDPAIEVNYEFSTTVGVCDDAYQIQRYWAGADRSGNAVNHRQIIDVSDSQPPVFEAVDSVCILPNRQYKEFPTYNMFVAHDNCDTVSFESGNLHIVSCNSTHGSSSPGYFDVTCHFDEARSILSVYADVEENETGGRTYFTYAHATDRCGNQAFFKREFWIPFEEEDAAMEGLVCETADVDRLIDNPYR